MPESRLSRYAVARDALLRRIATLLESDERVLAAWLSGSEGRGEGDAWADYDLHVAVKDEDLRSFLDDRPALYEALGEVALVQDDIPGQPTVADRFHLVNFVSPEGPIEVDWSFLPASTAEKPVGHRTLFEKRAFQVAEARPLPSEERRQEARRWSMFFWAMAPIAVRFCGRGETARAARQIGLLSRALICLWRLLDEGPSVAPWVPDSNRPIEESYDARLPRLGRTISPGSAMQVVETLCAEAEQLQARLTALDAAVDASIIEQTRAMVLTARPEIEARRFRSRRFR